MLDLTDPVLVEKITRHARQEGFQDPVFWALEDGAVVVVESFDTKANLSFEELVPLLPVIEMDEDGEIDLIWP